MKPLKLTQRHKKRLLEMCEKLFPEEANQWALGPTNDNDGNKEIICLFASDGYCISWYEFCILHLSKKLFDALVEKGLYYEEDHDDWLYDDMSFLDNPINFFYFEFKKLTDEKDN